MKQRTIGLLAAAHQPRHAALNSYTKTKYKARNQYVHKGLTIGLLAAARQPRHAAVNSYTNTNIRQDISMYIKKLTTGLLAAKVQDMRLQIHRELRYEFPAQCMYVCKYGYVYVYAHIFVSAF
jgi:hypothetical protein